MVRCALRAALRAISERSASESSFWAAEGFATGLAGVLEAFMVSRFVVRVSAWDSLSNKESMPYCRIYVKRYYV
jgi:hypothetical protein